MIRGEVRAQSSPSALGYFGRIARREAAEVDARRRVDARTLMCDRPAEEVFMNRVLLTGRLTRDPEMRSLPSGKVVTNFSVATNEYRGGEERTEYHSVVTWERLAEICGQYLGKGQMVSLEGRLQTRRWEDDRKLKHYRTEIVASSVEMLSGRRKKDYAAEAAAQALETQAEVMGLDPVDPEDYEEDAAIDTDGEAALADAEAVAA
jgi:single stranded DNA-binding protein